MLEKISNYVNNKKQMFGILIFCFSLLFSALAVPVRSSQMIFAFNMNNLFRSTAVSEYLQNFDDNFLISGENTKRYYRVF